MAGFWQVSHMWSEVKYDKKKPDSHHIKKGKKHVTYWINVPSGNFP